VWNDVVCHLAASSSGRRVSESLQHYPDLNGIRQWSSQDVILDALGKTICVVTLPLFYSFDIIAKTPHPWGVEYEKETQRQFSEA
jgi:hypothetical protein